MLTTDLIQLIETLRKLINRKGELDKEYFDNFIQPLWITFSEVHKDYMQSLRRYSKLITQESYDIASLMNEIQQDSIYSADMRIELYNLAKATPDPLENLITSNKNWDPVENSRKGLLLRFLWGFERYFGPQWKLSQDENSSEIRIDVRETQFWFGRLQEIRRYLVVYLSRKGIETNREKAKEFFDKVALERQHIFEDISSVYTELRKELLK